MTPPKMLETASAHSLEERFLSGEEQKNGCKRLNQRLRSKCLGTAKMLGGRPLTTTEKTKKRSGWKTGYAPLALDYRYWIEEKSGCICEECVRPQREEYELFEAEIIKERKKVATCEAFLADSWSGCGCFDCDLGLEPFEPVPVLSKHGYYPSLKWLKDEALSPHPRVSVEFEVLDKGTGNVYCSAELIALRRDGIGPFVELVTFRWRGGRTGRTREFNFWKPMAPPWWRNFRANVCGDCGCGVDRGEGLFEKMKVLHRDGWVESPEGAKTYCQKCFGKRFCWWTPPKEVVVDWDGDEPVIASWEGIGKRLNEPSEKAKEKLKEAYVKAKRLSITFTEAAREQLEDEPEEVQKIAAAFAWNKALAEQYMKAGDLKRSSKVLNCRRCFVVFKCLTVGCGEEKTGGVTYACGDRVCAFCSDQRRYKALDDLLGKISQLGVRPEHISMLTFTIQNLVSEELTSDVWREVAHRTNMAFGLLACLGHNVPGAYRGLETTHRSMESGHHVHAHMIGEHEEAINQRLLERVWLIASGGAGYICDIRRSKNLKRAALETVKDAKGTVKVAQRTVGDWVTRQGVDYLTKLTQISDPHVLLATVKSMKGVQMTQPIGRWRRKVEVDNEEEPASDADLNHEGDSQPCSSCGNTRFEKRRRWLGFKRGQKKQNLDAVLALAATRKAQKASRGQQGPPR